MKKGKVYLVGSGPGDPELLTRKAWRLIQNADCIIYDHLVHSQVLNASREDCEKIYVGKQRGCHILKQEEINQLLAAKALRYACVVRLKGGDPYVFGRGGEEALHLKAHGIPFEIVPGISSSIAGPAYAGIPVTHRGISGGFHVVTAHNQNNCLADINFKSMAENEDTCIFLMGLSNLPDIVKNLLAAGKAPDTPAAVISHATLPSQQVVSAPLGELEEALASHPLPSPAIILVGETAALRKNLHFFEDKPLYGTSIFLPMPGNTPSCLSEKLYDLGANVHEVCTGKIQEISDALEGIRFSDYSCIVLTSRNAVKIFFSNWKRMGRDVRSLQHILFAAVGNATERELEKYGIFASIVPATFDSTSLWTALRKELTKDDRVLYLRGKLDDAERGCTSVTSPERPFYEDEHPKDSFSVHMVEIYKNISTDPECWKPILEENKFDLAVFTCSSSARRTLDEIIRTQNMEHLRFMSIGNQTSRTLRDFGIRRISQSEKAGFDSLIELILKQAGKS